MGFQRLSRVCSLLLVVFGLGIASDAQERRGGEGRWDYLGRAYVDGNRDRDRIAVNNNLSFRALQLEVRGGTIEFQRVVVHFENGADRELEIRERIPSGGRTRAVDLPGERRRIRSVEFWYSPDRWRSRPSVTLFGQRSLNNGDEYGWEQLGSAYVNGRVDHDTIAVTHRGTFRQVQLGVRRGTIGFQRVVVHFENGADHELEIRERITAGRKTRVIDLPGERRRIRSVEFWYSKENWRERPHVNLWARR